MNLKAAKRSALTGALIYTVFGVLAGLLLILIPTDLLLWLVFVIMGIVTVISNIPGVIMGLMSIGRPSGVVSLILSAISVAFGVVMIFCHEEILMIAVGIYMIILPLIDVILAKDHITQLKAELPKLIIGLILILLGPAGTIDVMFDVAGIVVIVLSVIYLAAVAISLHRLTEKRCRRGDDGTVEASFEDVTDRDSQ